MEQMIGSGAFKNVFAYGERYVLKKPYILTVEKDVHCLCKECGGWPLSDKHGGLSTELEYRIWQAVKGTRFERYFAPTTEYLPECKASVQLRADRVLDYHDPIDKEMRDAVTFLGLGGDVKGPNIGCFGGQQKMIDYAFGNFAKFWEVINDERRTAAQTDESRRLRDAEAGAPPEDVAPREDRGLAAAARAWAADAVQLLRGRGAGGDGAAEAA